MGISINGPSGIDTQYIIDSLTQLEQDKVTKVEKTKASYDVKLQAYSKVQSFVTDLGSKAYALSTETSFNVFKQSSSDETMATVTGSTGSVEGTYGITVYQLAKAEKLISTDSKVISQTNSLSSMGITAGTIKVDGTEITISATDTIQDLRQKINSSLKSDGTKLGVTASVLKISETNFRLVLTAQSTGVTGVAYEGQTLADLGLIANATGSKGNQQQILTSATSVQSAFAAMATGAAINYAGLDHNGNAVSNSFVKGSASTLDEFIAQVTKSFNTMVDVSVDGTGRLVVTDKQGGASRLSLSTLNFDGSAMAMSATQAGKDGAGVLQNGADAYLNIDGVNLTSKTNAIDDFITGVTVNLKKADPLKAVDVSIARDYDALTTKVKALFDSFNGFHRFSKDVTRYGNPSDKTVSKGDLAGDMTVINLVSQFKQLLKQQFSDLGSKYKNVGDIGVKTDATTGELTVDAEVFKKALTTDFESVTKLFQTVGVADNKNINLGRYTKDTQAGIYTFQEINAGTQIRATVQGGAESWDSDTRDGELVMFSSGKLSGLSVNAPAGTIASFNGGVTQFTFSKGIGALVKDFADTTTNSTDGLIALHQNTLRASMASASKRIDKMNLSVTAYRERLVKQYSDMEQRLSSIKAQSSRMMSALGLSTTSS